MPAYDYRCSTCHAVFEVTRRFGETADVACPECGAGAKRLYTPVGVVFKGSGFHNTDYRPRPKAEESSPSGKDSCSTSSSPACASCPASTAKTAD